jgi:hypothetical protein
MTRDEILAMQTMQQALSNAPKQAPQAPAPPAGMDPAFYSAMVSAGATPHAPQEPAQSPPQAQPVPIPAPSSAPLTPFPQQAPVMSQMSPAPAAPAMANINNNVAMPEKTFAPASQRPGLPQFNGPLTPNMGGYGAPPQVPGYGMPRQGQPFRPPALQQGLPSFLNGGGMSGFSTQPTGQELDPNLYGGMAPGMINGRSLFSRY